MSAKTVITLNKELQATKVVLKAILENISKFGCVPMSTAEELLEKL